MLFSNTAFFVCPCKCALQHLYSSRIRKNYRCVPCFFFFKKKKTSTWPDTLCLSQFQCIILLCKKLGIFTSDVHRDTHAYTYTHVHAHTQCGVKFSVPQCKSEVRASQVHSDTEVSQSTHCCSKVENAPCPYRPTHPQSIAFHTQCRQRNENTTSVSSAP